MSDPNPFSVYRNIQDGFIRYFNTAFWLRDESLIRERDDLLRRPGVVFNDVYLETQSAYEAGRSIADVLSSRGLSNEIADQLGEMLFESDGQFRLYSHQAAALSTSLSPNGSDKRNVVVTSGTGSGKTECFLLPIFARLLQERSRWGTPPEIDRWWDISRDNTPWSHARSQTRSDRPVAVRSIVLYPTNALVEDQISRLRRAMSASVRDGSPDFFFGRYTGATEGPQDVPRRTSESKVRQVASLLREMEIECDSIPQHETELLSQFSDPRVGEMLTRWDMISAPPDILVTNYSMLNVMLMRDREESIFDATASWLEEDESRCLTLVVDELHTYRGTQGTEVALIVRNLLRRLRLSPDSPQLRCIATSASLGEESGGDYVEQFFGVDKETFEIIDGSLREIPPSQPLPRRSFQEVAGIQDVDERSEHLSELANEFPIAQAVANACQTDGERRPISLNLLASNVFDRAGPFDDGALEAAFQALYSSNQDESLRFRAHMFVRMIRGVWACSNPNCDAIEDEYRSDQRRIGRLYSRPTTTCACGSRVLDLLYCYQCGEAFLGGFATQPQDIDEDAPFWYLGPGEDVVPAREQDVVFRRSHGSYMWLWPRRPPGNVRWTHRAPDSPRATEFSFRAAAFNPGLGLLLPGSTRRLHLPWFRSSSRPGPVADSSPPRSMSALFLSRCEQGHGYLLSWDSSYPKFGRTPRAQLLLVRS